MKVDAVYHTGFTVSDIERSIAFYRDLLGLTLFRRQQGTAPYLSAITGFAGVRLEVALLQTPDGRGIVAVIHRKTQPWELAIVSVADGSIRSLKSFDIDGVNWEASLSPDGKYVAFDLKASEYAGQFDVAILAIDSGRVTRLEHPADERDELNRRGPIQAKLAPHVLDGDDGGAVVAIVHAPAPFSRSARAAW